MVQQFVSILNGSITAGWVVLGILLLRLVLRKTPKWILCSLWALVGLRLLWPSTLCDYTEQLAYPKTEDHNFEQQFWVSGRCGEYGYEQWACTLCGKTKIVLKERGSYLFYYDRIARWNMCIFCGLIERIYDKQPTYIPTN